MGAVQFSLFARSAIFIKRTARLFKLQRHLPANASSWLLALKGRVPKEKKDSDFAQQKKSQMALNLSDSTENVSLQK